MSSHKEFLADAMSHYESLPNETNEIYKKYQVDLPLSFAEAELPSDSKSHAAEADSVCSEIESATKIKFDAIISSHYAKSNSPEVRIYGTDDVDKDALMSKMFKSSEDKLAAFANASSKHFIFIERAGANKQGLNMLFVNTCNLSSQVFFNVAPGSKLELFELHVSSKDCKGIASTLREVVVPKESEIEINSIHNENEGTDVVSLCKCRTDEKSRFRANFVYVGGRNTKTKNIADSAGQQSSVDISELAYGSGDQKFDLTTFITNSKPYSIARLESGAALEGKSHCMLKGFAKVDNGAKGCLSKITERGILLSRDARVDALPDMSIDYSNEVKATHSAATAPIDREALFYLESRGLDEKQARSMYIIAFLGKYVAGMAGGVPHEAAMSIMLNKLDKSPYTAMPSLTTKGAWISSRRNA